MQLEDLIKALIEALYSKDRLVIFYGPSNTGKSFTVRILAEIFGPFVNLDEKQLSRDNLILDDVIRNKANCIWLEELNFDLDYSPQFKRILSGYKQNGRYAKQTTTRDNTYRCPIIFITTNRNPHHVAWLNTEGIRERLITINWQEPLPLCNTGLITDYIAEGKQILHRLLNLRIKDQDVNFINREFNATLFNKN